MRRLLWIGDAGVSTGFARATHAILDTLRHTYDVHVLGLNYHGDPHPYPYPIYPCAPGGDPFGYGRVKDLVEGLGPSVVVVQNDPWNMQAYLARIGNVPTIGVIAVDGKHCQGTALHGLALAIFWTAFAREEAGRGGYTGPSQVIPLGVDQTIYRPSDQTTQRARLQLPEVFAARGLPPTTFLIGSVGRNQPRKRLDLTLAYFAEWVHSRGISDAALWLHVAPTPDDAFDLQALGAYYGIADRLFVPALHPMHGLGEAQMARVYGLFDVLWSTTVGEGWGLPVQEAMACGVPCLVPDWSALGEWTEDAAIKVPCTATAVAPSLNTVGGIADRDSTLLALDALYEQPALRALMAERALALVSRPTFRWPAIASAYQAAIERALYPRLVNSSVGRREPVGEPSHPTDTRETQHVS